jgi:hypothetical protein
MLYVLFSSVVKYWRYSIADFDESAKKTATPSYFCRYSSFLVVDVATIAEKRDF